MSFSEEEDHITKARAVYFRARRGREGDWGPTDSKKGIASHLKIEDLILLYYN